MPNYDVIISQSERPIILSLFSEPGSPSFPAKRVWKHIFSPGENYWESRAAPLCFRIASLSPLHVQGLSHEEWGKCPGAEICWEFLMLAECFTSIFAGSSARCYFVTTCPLIETSKRPRSQNQAVHTGGPQSLLSASYGLSHHSHSLPWGDAC